MGTCRGAVGAQIDGLERRLAENEVQQRGVVCLDDKEKDLFEGDIEQRRPGDHVAGIAPDARTDEVRVPGNGSAHGDLHCQRRRGSMGASRTVMRKTTLKTSSLVNSGRYSSVSSTAGGMVYLAWLQFWLVAAAARVGQISHVHQRVVKAHDGGSGDVVGCALAAGRRAIHVNSSAPVRTTKLDRARVAPGTQTPPTAASLSVMAGVIPREAACAVSGLVRRSFEY
jgi:hypothetical protein